MLQESMETGPDGSERRLFLPDPTEEGRAKIDVGLVPEPNGHGILKNHEKFEQEMLVEQMKAGIAAAKARGRCDGRPYKMTVAKVRLVQAAVGQPETKAEELCAELGFTRQTPYRHVAPDGSLRADGQRLLERKKT
jgi:hypothetical protein